MTPEAGRRKDRQVATRGGRVSRVNRVVRQSAIGLRVGGNPKNQGLRALAHMFSKPHFVLDETPIDSSISAGS